MSKMKAERYMVPSCCGKTSIILKINQPLTTEHLKAFVALGFNEAKHFTDAGILYADNMDLIITGPFGSDRLQIKCKKTNCEQKISDFEVLLDKI